MENLAMQHKLQTGECLSVLKEGFSREDGTFQLRRFVENKDYCDPVRERWIWSIGRRFSDGVIFAATDTRYYDNPNFEGLFLR